MYVAKAWLPICFVFPDCLFLGEACPYSRMSQLTLTCCPNVKEDNRWLCLLGSVTASALVPGRLTCMLCAGPEGSCSSLPLTKPGSLSESCQSFPFPVSRIICLWDQFHCSPLLPLPCPESPQSCRV